MILVDSSDEYGTDRERLERMEEVGCDRIASSMVKPRDRFPRITLRWNRRSGGAPVCLSRKGLYRSTCRRIRSAPFVCVDFYEHRLIGPQGDSPRPYLRTIENVH